MFPCTLHGYSLARIGPPSSAPVFYRHTENDRREKCSAYISSLINPLFAVYAGLAAGMVWDQLSIEKFSARRILPLLKLENLVTSHLPIEFQLYRAPGEPLRILFQAPREKRQRPPVREPSEAETMTDAVNFDSEDGSVINLCRVPARPPLRYIHLRARDLQGKWNVDHTAWLHDWIDDCADVVFVTDVLNDGDIGAYANERSPGPLTAAVIASLTPGA